MPGRAAGTTEQPSKTLNLFEGEDARKECVSADMGDRDAHSLRPLHVVPNHVNSGTIKEDQRHKKKSAWAETKCRKEV